MRDYKISIIVPVYNLEDYLDDAIGSLLAQSIGFENIEVLFSDDASTDRSGEILDAYARKYNNVRVIRAKRNSGYCGAARNAALDAGVSAPYIMFLDGDDMLGADACALLCEAIEENGDDIASGTLVQVEKDRRGRWAERNQLSVFSSPRTYTFGERITREQAAFISCFSSKIYRTELIERFHIRFQEDVVFEDAAFLLAYLSVCKTGHSVNDVVYLYRIRRTSLSFSRDESFYRSAAISKIRAIETTKTLGRPWIVADYFRLIGEAEGVMEELIAHENLSDDAIERILDAWQGVLVYAKRDGIEFQSVYANILADDMSKGDMNAAYFHFFELRKLYRQRKQELDNIFSSRSWRTLAKIRRVFGRE